MYEKKASGTRLSFTRCQGSRLEKVAFVFRFPWSNVCKYLFVAFAKRAWRDVSTSRHFSSDFRATLRSRAVTDMPIRSSAPATIGRSTLSGSSDSLAADSLITKKRLAPVTRPIRTSINELSCATGRCCSIFRIIVRHSSVRYVSG